MLRGAEMTERMSDPVGPDRSRKRGTEETGLFATLLQATETRMNDRAGLGDCEAKEAPKTKSEETLKAQSPRPAESPTRADERTEDETTPAADRGRASDTRTDPSSSDPGRDPSGGSAESVDGCENGIQPGASTEAAVNAPTIASDASAVVLPELPILAEGDRRLNMVQRLGSDLASAESSSAGPDGDAGSETRKVLAKPVSPQTQMFGPNPALGDQRIFFDAGLAGHFVRLLTDQFDQMREMAGAKIESPNSIAATGSGSSVQSGGRGAGSMLDLATQAQTSAVWRGSEEDGVKNLNRVLQVIRSNLGQRQSQMTVQLEPPELGRVRLEVKLVDSDLRLLVTTQTAEARQLFLDRMDTLRSNLEQGGINLSRFEVVTKGQESSNGQPWSQNQDSTGQQAFGGGGYHQPREQQTQTALPSSEESEGESVMASTGTIPEPELNLVA